MVSELLLDAPVLPPNKVAAHAELVGGVNMVNEMSDRPAAREVKAEELPYSAKTELAGGK